MFHHTDDQEESRSRYSNPRRSSQKATPVFSSHILAPLARQAFSRRCSEVFRSSMCAAECALQQTSRTARPVVGKCGYIVRSDGARIPISVSTAALTDREGHVIGWAETFRDLSEVEALRSELEGRSRVGDLMSRSPLMQRVFESLPVIAACPSTVLVLGETGTGKELVARTTS
jgi:transcriptional regulator with PAS, ATPase and Fis domain